MVCCHCSVQDETSTNVVFMKCPFISFLKTQKDNYEFLVELYEHVLGQLTEGTVYLCVRKKYSEVHPAVHRCIGSASLGACAVCGLYAGAVLGNVYQAGLSYVDTRKPELKPHLVKNFG